VNIILLSGGSGKRLWPLSNNIRSKQFVKIFKKKDGTFESMLQRVYRQIKEADIDAHITIATSKEQVPFIYNQLGEEVCISVEPCRRDTFPAIALSTAYLVDMKHIDPNKPVIVCPIDPYTDEYYFKALKELADQVEKDEANLVLLGIEPTNPSEKFGYIIPDGYSHIAKVNSFKEKPTVEVATKYINKGALWNAGVFAFKPSYLLKKAHELIDFTDYNDLLKKYETINKISFDYAVVEHETKIQVIRFSGTWKDIGTWNALTEALMEPIVGKGIMNDTCSDVHIINELDIPILAVGLHNVVVSASEDGILICDKEQSEGLKPLITTLEQQDALSDASCSNSK
jgi:mannose-1-phosphate guanylyltransferase